MLSCKREKGDAASPHATPAWYALHEDVLRIQRGSKTCRDAGPGSLGIVRIPRSPQRHVMQSRTKEIGVARCVMEIKLLHNSVDTIWV